MTTRASSPPNLKEDLPDRVSVEPDSEFYDPYWKKIGVKFRGRVIFDVIEVCVSEGWVRRAVLNWNGTTRRDGRNRVMTVTHKGEIELYRR